VNSLSFPPQVYPPKAGLWWGGPREVRFILSPAIFAFDGPVHRNFNEGGWRGYSQILNLRFLLPHSPTCPRELTTPALQQGIQFIFSTIYYRLLYFLAPRLPPALTNHIAMSFSPLLSQFGFPYLPSLCVLAKPTVNHPLCSFKTLFISLRQTSGSYQKQP
jgi:hypothetical protein